MTTRKPSLWPKRLLIVGLVASGIGAAVHFRLLDQLRLFVGAIDSLGFWGPVLFVLIYVAAAVLMIPGSILTLGAGAAFGMVKGFALVSIASTAGAIAAFLVGRYLAREKAAQRIEGSPTFAAIDQAIAAEGWKIVGLTRLTPLIPYTLLNYALSLTKVRFIPYALATWIGMIPGTLMYVYLGSLGNTGASRERTAGEWALLMVGLIATITVTLVISRAAKKALAHRT